MAFWAGCVFSNIMGLDYFWQLFFFSPFAFICVTSYTHARTHTPMYITLSLILFPTMNHIKGDTTIMDWQTTWKPFTGFSALWERTMKFFFKLSCLWNYEGRWQHRSSTCNPYKRVQSKWRIRWKTALLPFVKKENRHFFLDYLQIYYVHTTLSVKNNKTSIDKKIVI